MHDVLATTRMPSPAATITARPDSTTSGATPPTGAAADQHRDAASPAKAGTIAKK